MLDLGIEDASDPPAGVLVLVDNSIYQDISASVQQYMSDLELHGTSAGLELWPRNDDVEALRSFIQNYPNIDSAFLIGDLPAAWYEQTAFEVYEHFPCDLYLMSKNTDWKDSDGNGILDSHSKLEVSIYLSRINGPADQLIRYFERVHRYKTASGNTAGSAYIFKDDDWFGYRLGSDFGISRIFQEVKINENEKTTVLSNYRNELLPPCVNYVYQWIHATPSSLHIDNRGSYEIIRSENITSEISGMFYNLFDCSAARFTQENIGMRYLMNTDTGLAVTGSTKTGGNYYPFEFHQVLSLGGTWGRAFQSWYNRFAVYDDEWFLGMIILGDPTLQLTDAPEGDYSPSVRSIQNIIPPGDEEKEKMFRTLLEFKRNHSEE
ncbi:MAG: hypothetical protein JW874_03330 [Spirochaetales bacterium]|nr:hypothetical protein [Spirochaetales bacterium]